MADANNRKRKSKNDRTLERATNYGKQWTGPELEVALREDLTATQAAEMLGRSFNAVVTARVKATRDPRYTKLAGVARQ
jgi:hypothetical protein